MLTKHEAQNRSWPGKFRDAFSGVAAGIRGQNSFVVHGIAAIVVITCTIGVRTDMLTTSVLLLCIAVVFTAELFNSALEYLAKAITDQDSPYIRDALNIASGAVLVASIGAAVIGMLLFGEIVLQRLND